MRSKTSFSAINLKPYRHVREQIFLIFHKIIEHAVRGSQRLTMQKRLRIENNCDGLAGAVDFDTTGACLISFSQPSSSVFFGKPHEVTKRVSKSPDELESSAAEQSISESHQLLIAAQEGDGSAFGKLAASMRPFLKHVVGQQMQNALRGKADDSDLVQQTMVRAIENLEEFRGNTVAEWRGWLAAIAKNEARNAGRFWAQARRNAGRENSSGIDRVSGDTTVDSPSDIASRRERTQNLMAVLEQLANDQQQLVQWRHFEGLTHAEIAEKLNISEEAARQRWTSTVQQLRKAWKKSAKTEPEDST